MATRLLSFLHDIEQALLRQSGSAASPWEVQRVVNYKQGLARMALTPVAKTPGGSIFLQSFNLADGSLCLKANLAWDGTETTAQRAVYSKPEVNWPAEAQAIASAWLTGPSAASAPAEAAAAAPAQT